MKIVLFASPGIIGPFVFASLMQMKHDVKLLVLPSAKHSVSPAELLEIARQSEIDVISPEILNDDVADKIRKVSPDIILVATYDKKIPKGIYGLAKIGAFNIHPSLLPLYRGACPEFWVLRNGEEKTGVTLHFIDDSFDTGNILIQHEVKIAPNDTVGSLSYKLGREAVKILIEFFDMLNNSGRLLGIKQDDSIATFAPMVDINTLRIDWRWISSDIYNLVRAANPVGGAWSLFRGFQLKVWNVGVSDIDADGFMPGEIAIFPDSRVIAVKSADNFIELKVVQYALYYILDGWSFCMSECVKDKEVIG